MKHAADSKAGPALVQPLEAGGEAQAGQRWTAGPLPPPRCPPLPLHAGELRPRLPLQARALCSGAQVEMAAESAVRGWWRLEDQRHALWCAHELSKRRGRGPA